MDTLVVPAAALTLVGARLTLSFARDLWLALASERWAAADGRIIAWGGHGDTPPGSRGAPCS